MVKNLPVMWRPRFNPWGSRRSPGEGNGYPLLYSCLEIPWTQGPGRLQSMGVPELDMTEQLTLKCYTNQNLGE